MLKFQRDGQSEPWPIHRPGRPRRTRQQPRQRLNGLQLVLVTLAAGHAAPSPNSKLQFYNANPLAAILADINVDARSARRDLPDPRRPARSGRATPRPGAGDRRGGRRRDRHVCALTVEPIGDYSTYTLGRCVHPDDRSASSARSRSSSAPAASPTTARPTGRRRRRRRAEPAIDYLAKDYDSFRHTLIAAMMERVPGWQPTSEADLDQVLIDLFSAAADELSDYQDRVMNEAYLVTGRKRVSLARHARLMDYHIHQGNQASTWLALEVTAAGLFTLPAKFTAWTGQAQKQTETRSCSRRVRNAGRCIRCSTACGSIHLERRRAGARRRRHARRSAARHSRDRPTAETVRDLIRDGTIPRLLVQEWLNPATGREAGRDPQKRQLLELLEGNAGADRAARSGRPTLGSCACAGARKTR